MSGDERELLRRLAGGPVSGDVLARDAGLTRAAVWKRIQALRDAGLRIDARAGQGYALGQPLDLLDATSIQTQISRQASTLLVALQVAWSIDSTNAELLRQPADAAGAKVLLAEQQTGGRGRRGRSWASPLASNLYLSVSRQFSGGLARLGGLSLVTGVAVAEALHALGFAAVGLKWPNDLLVGDRKLSGILIEGGGEHGGPVRAVIGIGLNVRMPQAQGERIDQPWIDLQALMPTAPSRNVLAAAVLSRLLPALEAFDADGLAPFLARYAALDLLAGQPVSVNDARGVRHGEAAGLGEDGALRVRFDNELQSVYAGDVSVRKS
ncbi:bifunctional biotin--[acetyl-CoA-carboxylase] ligase/biotin operon repressor BirA [Pseudoxanthomonas indica]|uniref:Bifunctional ligase/repressor BirA n=1 Tax=Pseudoxanthomonas indica TaxID=428993 RepID=A0A1T5JZ39_9GAMM|nr:bifunctional biotin--[acetyl-CoA-carboxylase] ligase/biotin operon repressor BirA [Pseudoxanthomonas indica]GGD45529.1 bifunctional ligase/repressor BirA [Pseudoxanthomonas indica]SKC56812.1 BirA family transcriptional regulator, biotin operon repressor / biotin-[acetyl-CoA-carboxylase] ligase [Pseudoxanthomonas indica]